MSEAVCTDIAAPRYEWITANRSITFSLYIFPRLQAINKDSKFRGTYRTVFGGVGVFPAEVLLDGSAYQPHDKSGYVGQIVLIFPAYRGRMRVADCGCAR